MSSIRYRFAFIFCLLPLVLGGCIMDKSGECPAGRFTVSFVYDLNTTREDLFHEEVNHLSLYFYDHAGILALSLETPRESLEHGNTLSVELGYGAYTLVVWGNLDNRNFECRDHESMEMMTTSLTCVDDEGTVSETSPGNLFHAISEINFVKNGEKFTVGLMKNTKTIHVRVSGMENLHSRISGPEDTDLHIISRNGYYNHLNVPRDTEPLTYLPERVPEGRRLTATFQTLRLFSGERESAISVRMVTDGNSETVYSTSLMELLELENPGAPQEYYDRKHEYYLDLGFDTDGEVSLTFDEWEDFYNKGKV